MNQASYLFCPKLTVAIRTRCIHYHTLRSVSVFILDMDSIQTN